MALARKRFVNVVERVDRDVLGERNGWRCGICGELIDPALRYTDPLSRELSCSGDYASGYSATTTPSQTPQPVVSRRNV